MKTDFIYVFLRRWQEPAVRHLLVSPVFPPSVCDGFSSRGRCAGASSPVNPAGARRPEAAGKTRELWEAPQQVLLPVPAWRVRGAVMASQGQCHVLCGAPPDTSDEASSEQHRVQESPIPREAHSARRGLSAVLSGCPSDTAAGTSCPRVHRPVNGTHPRGHSVRKRGPRVRTRA